MATVSPQLIARPTSDRSIALRLLGEGLFWLVVLQLVTGIYLQSQLALFDGRIVVPNGAPKMLLVLGIIGLGGLVLWFSRGEIKLRSSMLPTCVFTCYLVADLAILVVTSKLPITALLFGFNKYFLFFAALPAAALLRPRISPRQMNLRFMLLIVPLVGLALAQYALNDPLLIVVAEDESFEIPAVDFYGQIRAFSLFRGVLECGQGMAFLGGLLLAQLCLPNRRHVRWKVVLLGLTAAGCFVTFRRGAYLEYAATAMAVVAICRNWPITRWLPWLYLAVAIGLASAGPIVSSVQGEGMMSSASLSERQEAWQRAFDYWLGREDASILVGTGMAQTSLLGTGLAQIESTEVEYFLVDNGFLAVGAQLGLIGLALWFWVMQALWKDMLATAWQTRSALTIAVAALLSTWMMRDMFDPLFALYPLYVYLVFWSQDDTARASVSPTTTGQVAPCV